MQYLFRISDYGLVKHIRLGTTSRQKDTPRVSGHPYEGQGHLTQKQTIIFSAIAMNVFIVKTSYFIFQQ